MTNEFLNEYTFKSGLTVKNRIIMSPMTTMTSFYNGMVTSDEIAYYQKRAGGPGMIITGVANVSESGKGFEGELSVASDDMIPGLAQIAAAIHHNGTKAILQIFHAGRKSTSKILRGAQPVSASPLAATYPPDSETPRELTSDEIETIIDDFGQATRRAVTAGFDGVELHGANTYLLQQFFSPNSNQRSDQWGGDRTQRLAFPLAVIAKARAAASKATRPFLVGYRLSPEEIETPGIRIDDSLFFAEQIRDKVDYLHISMGSYKRSSLNDKSDTEPLLAKFAAIVSGHTPLIGVGSVETPKDADNVLALGADFAAIGRELIREPQWVQKVENNDGGSIRTELSPYDMTELAIPAVMQVYLSESFKPVMHFTTDTDQAQDYQNQLAPMEGFEKKL
ncbi:NADH-dependent flavin oxidoreductase [Furfurilactobacillus curtus]|uniref:NADH-dependent flavin oxidoreductase n=1 Tax=Furfurilactobacillus curtus TaxID=1746200 RepID=A0ABQ5JPE1_9LACO